MAALINLRHQANAGGLREASGSNGALGPYDILKVLWWEDLRGGCSMHIRPSENECRLCWARGSSQCARVPRLRTIEESNMRLFLQITGSIAMAWKYCPKAQSLKPLISPSFPTVIGREPGEPCACSAVAFEVAAKRAATMWLRQTLIVVAATEVPFPRHCDST